MSIIEKALEKLNKGNQQTDAKTRRQEPVVQSKQQQVVHQQPAPVIPASSTVDTNSVNTTIASPDVVIDIDRLRALGMVTPDMERSKIAEEYRLIKRPLLKNASGEGATVVPHANLIMVTSSLPGEGKTFCSINLAMSIALEMDKTVLLVDADVAKPSVSRTLGLKPDKGLVDYLLGEVNSLPDILKRTNIPKLTIIQSGKRHSHSTELLASDSMKSLLQELSTRYPDRIVIFDSPPLLATSESSVVANQMGQVVMVVESERTGQEVVKEAVGMLDPNMIIGMVLNKSGQLFGSDYYGSYSHYGSYGK